MDKKLSTSDEIERLKARLDESERIIANLILAVDYLAKSAGFFGTDTVVAEILKGPLK